MVNGILALAEASTPAITGGTNMWETITSGVSSFITGVVTPVLNMCSTNGVALAFLSVSFAGLGVRLVRKTISAFGRGR